MYTKSEENKTQKLLLPLDLLSVAAALMLAIYLRFHKNPGLREVAKAYNGLYPMIFILVLMIYIVVFFLNDIRHKPLIEQDPFEKTVNVIKNQIIMLIGLVCFLYLIRVGYWASRAVVLMLFIFSTIFDIVIRFLYGKALKRNAKKEYRPRRYLLITDTEADAGRTEKMIKKLLKPGDSIAAAVTADKASSIDRESYDEVLLYYTVGRSAEERQIISSLLRETGTPCRRILNEGDVTATAEMMGSMGDVPVIRTTELKEKCPVLGVNFSVANLSDAVRHIRENIENLRGKYICFGNVHTTVLAHEDKEYLAVQNGAVFVMPDGAPIHREQRKKGYMDAHRVAGPDFMGKLFFSAMDGKISMYFYGSTEETIKNLRKKLKENYPGLDIRGYESPPFRELTKEEDEAAVERINASGADIVWVGLGAPKQERWMAAHAGRINALMLGVGAGFDFHAGTVKRAPLWIQKIGMEWLYRLFQDPKRLLKRYIITNAKFYIYKIKK